MSKKDHICGAALMRLKPSAEIIASHSDVLLRSIPRVDLRMYDVALREENGQDIMDMCRKVSKAHLVAHEAMNVNEE
jgi:hypothetical protein